MTNTPHNSYKDFETYLIQGEPEQSRRVQSWTTAFGLQAVDGLTPSEYLVKTAQQHIEGAITIDDVRERVSSYYRIQESRTDEAFRTEEADKASVNIAKLLNEDTFSFSTVGYISLHKRIFDNVFKFAGKIREYNITKPEWVLNGETVRYAPYEDLYVTLDYDISKEVNFSYKDLSLNATIEHIAQFISNLWQIHPFAEGNTRTTAVFLIKYLRKLGFNAENALFVQNSWYFRNALVRANYSNLPKRITPSCQFLILFLRNLLTGEQNVLKNRFLHIDFKNLRVTYLDKANVSCNDSQVSVETPHVSVETLQVSVETLGKNAERILKTFNLIKQDPAITAKTLAEKQNLSYRTIERHLSKLKLAGLLFRIGSTKKGHWEFK